MKNIVYKLNFQNGVHIGNGRLSSSEVTIHADTIFSAICIEALKVGGENLLNNIVDLVKNNKLLISDALPYIDSTLYFPKPICQLNNIEVNFNLRKEFKKLEYIPSESINTYMTGEIDPVKENKKFSQLGKKELHQKVLLSTVDDDNELYSVGVYKFNEGCGLYIISSVFDDEVEKTLDSIFDSLQYAGIGGKRHSGYGRFSYEKVSFEMPNANAGSYMVLSSCMANDNELESAISNASYKLVKRSGFVQSNTYSEINVKKRDFYLFDAGSVFKEKFVGDVFDVSIEGNHPVYKYAKPMFVRIGGGV